MKKINILLLLLTTLLIELNAQTDYQFSNYLNNQLAVNPAYAGSSKDLNFSILGRSQWFGLKNAPQSFAFNGHTILPSIGGIGLSVYRDKLGSENNTSAKISYAYMLKIGDSTNLTFGLSAGINSRSIDIDRMVFENNEPILFNGGIESQIKSDFGFGVRFMWKKFDLQLSATHLSSSFDSYDYNSIPRHFYGIASYSFRFSPNFTLTPSIFFKSNGVFNHLDINARALFQERFIFGVGYRLNDAILASVGMKITDNISFMYGYDFVTGTSNSLSRSNHEIVLIAKFNGFYKTLGKVDSKSSF